jgi:hypothetical protein
MRRHLMALCRVALLGVVLLLIVAAYFPFAWDPPRIVHNDVTRSADGILRFGEMNSARTPGTPAWFPAVRTSGHIQIHLEFDPQSLHQQASIMMLASDFWHTDFAVGQDHSDLLVWLRRPGSDANGDPPFVVGRVIRAQRWNSVDVVLQHDELRIYAEGRIHLTEHLAVDSPRVWGKGEIAIGDEVHGGGPWRGEIRQADVRTPGYVVDYIRPGTLSIPKSYLYAPDHLEPFSPANPEEWLLAFVLLLSFIPVGFLIVWARRPPVSPLFAVLLATVLAVMLAAGKFLFHDRHTSLPDVPMEVAGALFGAWLASRLVPRYFAQTLPGFRFAWRLRYHRDRPGSPVDAGHSSARTERRTGSQT